MCFQLSTLIRLNTLVWTQFNLYVFTPIENGYKRKRFSVSWDSNNRILSRPFHGLLKLVFFKKTCSCESELSNFEYCYQIFLTVILETMSNSDDDLCIAQNTFDIIPLPNFDIDYLSRIWNSVCLCPQI